MSSYKKISIFIFGFIIFSSTANATNDIQIKNAWSPEAPPVAKVLAGYMTIKNLSNKDIQIIAIKSPLFKRVEIHLSEMKNGMMSMVKQDSLSIKAKSQVELKSGGLHMMLMGKLKPIRKGAVIPVTFTFDNNKTINSKLDVKVDEQPEVMHHHHH